MTRVLYDHQVFDMQKYGGISRYFTELFNEFSLLNTVEPIIPFRYTENEYLQHVSSFKSQHIAKRKLNFDRKNPVLRKATKAFDHFDPDSNLNSSKRSLSKGNFDIFHPTYYDTYFLNYLKNKPFVLTIHDMIYEIYPEYFPRDKRTIENKKKLIYKADKIIVISESTKKDLLKFYDIQEEKLSVIYHGNSMIPSQNKTDINFDIPKKYILYVGSRAVYKNFDSFIKASAPLLKMDPELFIVTSGGYQGNDGFSASELKLITLLGIAKQVKSFSVNDKELSFLYENALCFVFPTLYEGFGFPVLEAFACNCPAIISNKSSLPEVGGDAVEYIDPLNIENITEVINKVITNLPLRNLMIEKGKKQLEKFSWRKAAQETYSLYRELL